MNRILGTLLTLSLASLWVASCERGGNEPASTNATPAPPAIEPATNPPPKEEPPKEEPPKEEPPKSAKTVVVFSTPEGERRVPVEVVSNPATIQRGLMYREHLPPDHGMLFVFSTDRVRSFWMKNTLIPLDMLFVREDGSIAGIERNTTPLSLESRTVGIPTRYVLELNGGWTEKYKIEPGAVLEIANLPVITGAPL